VLAGALILAVGLIAVTVFVLNVSRPPAAPVGVVTAALTVIPVPAATAPVSALATTSADAPTGLEGGTPSPPGELAIGAFVQISGTEGDGLHLRVSPGLTNDARFLGAEAEVFQVEAGPQEADGYVWWYLVSPVDSTRCGWAVESYLEVVRDQ